MTDRVLDTGKLPGSLLRELLEPATPAPAELLLPPAIGEDAGVVAVAGGALIVASDPVTLTSQSVAAHAVVVNANDVAVMGARPRWFLCCALLPVGTRSGEARALFKEMHAALAQVGASLVGGHTEVTDAVLQPVVVGQMFGLREDGRFVRTGGVRAGDVILQIGTAPIEGAAVLAIEAGERLCSVAPNHLALARVALQKPGISVVEPALLAAELGATALHDPTEGGLSAGLHEVAEASGIALEVDTDAVLWFEPGLAVCRALGADPWGALASGTLIAAFPQDAAKQARGSLEAANHPTALIAHARAGAGVHSVVGGPLVRYERDEVTRVLTEPAGG